MNYYILQFISFAYLLYISIYWLLSGICYLLDCITLYNKKLSKYKIQQVNINFDKYHKTIKHVFINQILSFPFIFIMYPIIVYIGNDMSFIVPSIYNICKHLLLTLFVFDILFYIGHFLGHRLYFSIHKTHHEWNSPVGVCAHYNHIYEHIMLNVILPALSTIIVKSNVIIMLLWIFISTFYVVCSHSGYYFLGATKHDNHHKLYKYNFGICFTDYIFNTHYE